MRTTLTTAALGMTLLLAGCSTDTEPTTTTTGASPSSAGGSTATEQAGTSGDSAPATDGGAGTAAAGGAPMSDPVCAGFFQNVPVSLAERAETDRTILENGEVSDPASFGEVNLLSQRIDALLQQAEGEQAALLERINAPFDEASSAVLDDPEVSPADPEIALPEIDVTDSAAAQEEFLASCSG